jgi:hypothetical protein
MGERCFITQSAANGPNDKPTIGLVEVELNKWNGIDGNKNKGWMIVAMAGGE